MKKFWRFGGVNKHLFRKINLIVKVQQLLYRLNNNPNCIVWESTSRRNRVGESTIKKERATLSTRRLDFDSQILLRLVESIYISTRRLICIDLSTWWYRLVESILSTRRLDCIDSSIRLYRLVDSIISTLRTDWMVSHWVNTIDLAQNTIDSTKQCNWVDGFFQRIQITVNHKSYYKK